MYYLLQTVRFLVAWWGVGFFFGAIDTFVWERSILEEGPSVPTWVQVVFMGAAFWAFGFPLRRFTRTFETWSPSSFRRCAVVTAVLAVLALVGEYNRAHAADKCPDVSQAVIALDMHVENVLKREGIAFDGPGKSLGSYRNAKRLAGRGCVYHAYTWFGVWNGRVFVNRYFRATMRSDGGWLNWQVANLEMN